MALELDFGWVIGIAPQPSGILSLTFLVLRSTRWRQWQRCGIRGWAMVMEVGI